MCCALPRYSVMHHLGITYIIREMKEGRKRKKGEGVKRNAYTYLWACPSSTRGTSSSSVAISTLGRALGWVLVQVTHKVRAGTFILFTAYLDSFAAMPLESKQVEG
jgi:hypothetical protein